MLEVSITTQTTTSIYVDAHIKTLYRKCAWFKNSVYFHMSTLMLIGVCCMQLPSLNALEFEEM